MGGEYYQVNSHQLGAFFLHLHNQRPIVVVYKFCEEKGFSLTHTGRNRYIKAKFRDDILKKRQKSVPRLYCFVFVQERREKYPFF